MRSNIIYRKGNKTKLLLDQDSFDPPSIKKEKDKYRRPIILHSTPIDTKRENLWLNLSFTAPHINTTWGRAKEEIKSAAFSTRKILQGIVSFIKGESMAIDPSKNSNEDFEVPIQVKRPQPFFKNKENIPPNGEQTEVSATSLLRRVRVAQKRDNFNKKRPRESSSNSSSTKSIKPGKMIKICGDSSTSAEERKAPLPTNKLRRSQRQSGPGDVTVSYEDMDCFLKLVETDSVISTFLKRDSCRRYADSYLLAMTFTYLIRAKIARSCFGRKNFFAALYLAHDMEEDEEELKYELFPWMLGSTWRKSYPTLLQARDDIFWALDCRAVVSKKCCDQVIGLRPKHWLWKRERPEYHGGAVREYIKHPSENGRPRGPEKSPLRCWMCLEKECDDSDTSYYLYLSAEEAEDSLDEDASQETVIHYKEKDSGFGSFLNETKDEELGSNEESNEHTLENTNEAENQKGVLIKSICEPNATLADLKEENKIVSTITELLSDATMNSALKKRSLSVLCTTLSSSKTDIHSKEDEEMEICSSQENLSQADTIIYTDHEEN